MTRDPSHLITATASILRAYQHLPAAMNSPEATVYLLTAGLQESGLLFRVQHGGGPARGLWQFERGTARTRGGVCGVLMHNASKYWAHKLCEARNVAPDSGAVHAALATDDVLAAGFARLLAFTDPKRLPSVTDAAGGWALYARTWRPGKPRPSHWAPNHRQALAHAHAAGHV